MLDQCSPSVDERRRCFWTTQPCGCGVEKTTCGDCCAPGMTQNSDGTLATNDWVQSLLLNMLNTDKRRSDSECGHNPATINGHWSESFIEGDSGLYGGAQRGYRVGTGLRYIDTGKYKIRELEALIEAELTMTANKLVQLGVARSVRTSVEYSGNYSFNAEILIFGPNNAPYGRVALLGQRDNEAGFFWSC